MPTPADIAKTIQRKRTQEHEERENAQEIELSINNHMFFDDECDHHCSGCCPALYLESNL